MCDSRVADVLRDPTHGLILRIGDDGVETRVKTTSSRRLVPLHPELIACGFDAYVTAREAAGDTWLFPDLVPDVLGNRSGNWTKWFGRYLRSPTGAASPTGASCSTPSGTRLNPLPLRDDRGTP
jgi:hypothetical protein